LTTYSILYIYINFLALDEEDIALLKTYVSSLNYYINMLTYNVLNEKQFYFGIYRVKVNGQLM